MEHLRQAWALRIEGYGIQPTHSIYRGLREVTIPYRDGEPVTGREIVDRAVKVLREEGYGPEHPGQWWFVWIDEPERIRQSREWSRFNFHSWVGKHPLTMESGHWANIGFVYEARFTSRPNLIGGVSQLPIGTKLNIIAIHVLMPNDRWERVPVSFIGTVT